MMLCFVILHFGRYFPNVSCVMHGSIFPVTTPLPGNPRGVVCQKCPGVGNFIDRLVLGVGLGSICNYGIYYIMPECDGLDLACEPA